MAVARANGGVNDFGFNAQASSATVTVVCPTAVVVGNYLVAHYCTNDDIATAHGVSGGSATAWTNIIPFTKVSTLGSISVWIKKAEAADVGATFTFTQTGDTGKNNAFISAWTGIDDANPYTVGTVGSVTSGTTISYPGLTPTVDDVMVLLLGGSFNALNGTLDEPSVDGVTSTLISENPSGGSNSAWVDTQQVFALMTGHNGVAIPTVTGNVAVGAAATLGVMLALNPPGGGGGPTTETLEPDSVVGTPTGLIPSSGTNDAAGRLAALVATGGPYMAGTDPSGSSGSVGPVYPNARVGATGQTAFAWGGAPANVIDTSDTTASTEVSSSSALADYFSFAAGAFSGVPAGATITGVSVAIKHNAGTTNRVTPFLQLGTANGTLIGSEVDAVDNTVGGTTKLGTAAVTHTVTAFGAVPTLAQLQTSGAAGFGVRLRIARSSASTYVLFSIKVTVTYTTAGSTTPTDVRVTLQNPVDSLVTGAGTGVIHALLRKLGSGTNPTATIHIRRAGSNTDVGASSAITLSSASFTDQTYTFDQSILSGDGNDVEIFVNSAGAAGGLMEVDHIYWVAQTTPAAPSAAPVHRRLISRAALVRSNRY